MSEMSELGQNISRNLKVSLPTGRQALQKTFNPFQHFEKA
jgi:hypothetical protein